MLDVLAIVILFSFFALAIAYTHACESLKGKRS
jgi:hypothetical protein